MTLRAPMICAILLCLTPALLAACGSEVNGTGGGSSASTGGSTTTGTTTTTGSTGSTASTGSGGALPQGECRDTSDCASMPSAFCAPPGTPPGCGICEMPPNPCSGDADCKAMGASMICDTSGCICQPTCIEGCSVEKVCPLGETCGSDARCAPTQCQKDTDCPGQNFTCSGTCGRRACTSDAECQGTCVLGQCWESPGVCLEPAA